MFPSLLYSCETWGYIKNLENTLHLIERKALRACLGVKKGTPDDILYVEINKPDIIASIYLRQHNFYRKFIELDSGTCTAKSIWQKFMMVDDTMDKSFLEHYELMEPQPLCYNIEKKRNNIAISTKAMLIRYRELFNLEYNDILYNSMVDDAYRTIITRWRLSCHSLFIETGRYKIPYIPRDERKCMVCGTLEDESHALFDCRVHLSIRDTYKDLLKEYPSTSQMLNPKKEIDIIKIAKYIREIEKNMRDMKMIR